MGDYGNLEDGNWWGDTIKPDFHGTGINIMMTDGHIESHDYNGGSLNNVKLYND